jgi:hypothetical protein
VVSPSTCSVDVNAGQLAVAQKNRRTVSRIATGLPAITASARQMW